MTDNTKYSAIGADIFAGGFTIGVMDYFDIIAHLEHNNYGRKIKDRNLPGIETFLPPWPPMTADFIYANPPCAPFSTASHGRKESWEDDPRLSCFDDCFSLIDRNPEFLAIESVMAAWSKGAVYLIDKAMQANNRGYAATIILHDGKYLGLPQVRRRMFLVLHKLELAWHTHKAKQIIPCDKALTDPPVIYSDDDSYVHLDNHTKYLILNRRPNDNTLVHVHDRMGFGKGRGSRRPVYTSSICYPDKPAPTLLHCMHVHPTEPRYLTVREIARLSGYPDWWKWDIPVGPQTKSSLIARGVTPAVGNWLAKLVYESLEAGAPATPIIKLVDISKGGYAERVL
jgi:site-specific DNA-cytosine methylase